MEHLTDISDKHSPSSKSALLRPLVSRKPYTEKNESSHQDIQHIVICEGQEGQSPRVELVSKEGKIKRITITCACGKHIELDCEYTL